jgi:hypothetical protein
MDRIFGLEAEAATPEIDPVDGPTIAGWMSELRDKAERSGSGKRNCPSKEIRWERCAAVI